MKGPVEQAVKPRVLSRTSLRLVRACCRDMLLAHNAVGDGAAIAGTQHTINTVQMADGTRGMREQWTRSPFWLFAKPFEPTCSASGCMPKKMAEAPLICVFGCCRLSLRYPTSKQACCTLCRPHRINVRLTPVTVATGFAPAGLTYSRCLAVLTALTQGCSPVHCRHGFNLAACGAGAPAGSTLLGSVLQPLKLEAAVCKLARALDASCEWSYVS